MDDYGETFGGILTTNNKNLRFSLERKFMLNKKTILPLTIISIAALLFLFIRMYIISKKNIQPEYPRSEAVSTSKNEIKDIDNTGIYSNIKTKIIPNPKEDTTFDWTILDIHEALGLRWDNFSVDLDISVCTKSEIHKLINNWPIEGVSIDTKRQEQLKEMFVELAYSYGREDFAVWLDFLREAGEKVREDVVEGNRNGLVKTYQVPIENLAKDSWELLKQSSVVKGSQSNWQGLCIKGASIEFTRVTGTELQEPGKNIQKLRSCKYSFPHIAESPVSAGTIFSNEKEILFSDITFFVLHSDKGSGHIQPYVLRSWYDTLNNRWRPVDLSFFPDRNERIEISKIPIF